MPTQRATPESYYYSGQGRLLIGDRDANGRGTNFRFVGNVTGLSIDVTNTKFEHKESMSGQRAIDVSFVKETKAIIKFTGESLDVDNLSLGLYGSVSTTASLPVVDEEHVVSGDVIVLRNPNVTGVTITVGATSVNVAHFSVDPEFGTITVLNATVLAPGAIAKVSYTSGAHKRMDAFTQIAPPEKFLRFEGFNTINGDHVLLEAPRVRLEPFSSLQLITEDLATAEFTGDILVDSKITTGSKLFVERVITPLP